MISLKTLYVKNGLDGNNDSIELLLEDGKIKAVGSKLEVEAKETLNLRSKAYVSAGWIDDHTHCYEKLTLYYDDPDKIGYLTGVTTVIDAGSTGADNISDFYKITRNKITNVYAMINVSRTGILEQNELGDLEKIQFGPLKNEVGEHPDFIIGMKVRISKSVVVGNGVKPLLLAKEFQKRLEKKLPLMVHVGTNPPELSEIMAIMDSGDIMTHCYNGKKNGILDQNREIKPFVKEGLAKGIIFDIGHGTDSFNFQTAQTAIKNNIQAQSLSTDIYHTNRQCGPVYNMATCIEKMLYLGYEMTQILPMITTIPAKNFNLNTKGKLEAGYDADLTIFEINKGTKQLRDSNGNIKTTNTLINPIYSVVGGNVYSIGE